MKPSCKQGHAYDNENAYVYVEKSTGQKRYRCRKCHAERQKKRDIYRRGYV
jgi:hypothetical protein